MEFVNTDLIKVTLDVTTNLVFFYLTHAFKTLDNKQELRKQAWIGKRRNVHCNLSKQLRWHLLKLFIICQCVQQVSTQKTLKGPPIITTANGINEIQEVKLSGEKNVKLACPITGNPQPLIEWSKNGETIDFTWTRYKANSKKGFLKILKPLDSHLDSGIFICKGINGFGTEQVHVQLVVTDNKEPGLMLRKEDMRVNDGSFSKISSKNFFRPPTLTSETKSSPERYIARIGDKFSVFCEATGYPNPIITWFKDNIPIDNVVHSTGARSALQFSVMDASDGGSYTCKARNKMGETSKNYVLKVKSSLTLPPGSISPEVTVTVKPNNESILVGKPAALLCKVKSTLPPSIKWLKRLGKEKVAFESYGNDVISVGQNKYQFMQSEPVAKLSLDQYQAELKIPSPQISDAGMYICFVSDSSQANAWSYKSVVLKINPTSEEKGNQTRMIDTLSKEQNQQLAPTVIIVLIACLCGTILILLIIIGICLIRGPPGLGNNKPKRTISQSQEGSAPTVKRFTSGDGTTSSSSTSCLEAASPNSSHDLQKPLFADEYCNQIQQPHTLNNLVGYSEPHTLNNDTKPSNLQWHPTFSHSYAPHHNVVYPLRNECNGDYANPTNIPGRFTNLKNGRIQNIEQNGSYHPQTSFKNYFSNEPSNISTIVDPSYNLPLLPHGGTKLAFGYNPEKVSSKAINETHQTISHPPLQLIRNGNDIPSNHQYEVPFSQYSSVNNLTAPNNYHLNNHNSFQPVAKTIAGKIPMLKHYKDIVSPNLGDSLPSILDSAGYIHNNYNQNQNVFNRIPNSCKDDDRIQPQGSSNSNSMSSSMEKSTGNHIHILNSASFLGNV